MAREDHQSHAHHLVWLDENIHNFSNQQKLKQLRELDDKIQIFTDKNECITYIKNYDMKKTKSDIIFIISGSFSKETIPQIHNCPCINGIFIFCLDIKRHQQLKFLKLRGICTDIQDLIDDIQTSAKRESGPIDFSLFATQNNTKTGIPFRHRQSVIVNL